MDASPFAHLPELVRATIVKKLHLTEQARLRLTCRSWRDHLKAHELSHTVCLCSEEGWEEKAKHLKIKFPKLNIQLRAAYGGGPTGVEECTQLLENPYCDVVRLYYNFTSYESGQFQGREWLQESRQYQIDSIRAFSSLLALPVAQAKLQLKVKATHTHSGPSASELSTAFAKLVPYIAAINANGDIHKILQKPSLFCRLTDLRLTLPQACYTGDAELSLATDAAAVEKLQRLFLTLPKLSHLQLHATGASLQSAAVLSVLSKLPNVTCLKLDTGIMPCKLASQDLRHVTGLCLGREVTFDQPPANLHALHLAFLGLPQKPMLLQLRQVQRHVDISAGSCGAQGLTLTPCKQRCCSHNDLAAKHQHVHVEESGEIAMQPHVYLCD